MKTIIALLVMMMMRWTMTTTIATTTKICLTTNKSCLQKSQQFYLMMMMWMWMTTIWTRDCTERGIESTDQKHQDNIGEADEDDDAAQTVEMIALLMSGWWYTPTRVVATTKTHTHISTKASSIKRGPTGQHTRKISWNHTIIKLHSTCIEIFMLKCKMTQIPPRHVRLYVKAVRNL